MDTAHETQNFIKFREGVFFACIELCILIIQLKAISKMKYKIQWQAQVGKWQHYQTKTNEAGGQMVKTN